MANKKDIGTVPAGKRQSGGFASATDCGMTDCGMSDCGATSQTGTKTGTMKTGGSMKAEIGSKVTDCAGACGCVDKTDGGGSC